MGAFGAEAVATCMHLPRNVKNVSTWGDARKARVVGSTGMRQREVLCVQAAGVVLC